MHGEVEESEGHMSLDDQIAQAAAKAAAEARAAEPPDEDLLNYDDGVVERARAMAQAAAGGPPTVAAPTPAGDALVRLRQARERFQQCQQEYLAALEAYAFGQG